MLKWDGERAPHEGRHAPPARVGLPRFYCFNTLSCVRQVTLLFRVLNQPFSSACAALKHSTTCAYSKHWQRLHKFLTLNANQRHACTFSADSHGSPLPSQQTAINARQCCVSEAHGREKKVSSTAGRKHVWTSDPTCVFRTALAHFTLAGMNKAADNSRKKKAL